MDRSEWPPGPWDTETEDKAEFSHGGFPCLLVRGPAGAWCGYVGVPPGHYAHGKGYDDDSLDHVRVHGGLTYSDGCQVGGRICHVPALGEPDDVWWLGFDCNHSGDVSPKDEAYSIKYGWPRRLGTQTGWGGSHEYRTQDYARRQTVALAGQLVSTPLGSESEAARSQAPTDVTPDEET